MREILEEKMGTLVSPSRLSRYLDLCLYEYDLDGVYFENHHILPKSIFGENDFIVSLPFIKHVEAHMILFEEYMENRNPALLPMARAFHFFRSVNENSRVGTSRLASILAMSDTEKSEILVMIEQAKLANKLTGEANGFYGKTHSPESLQRMQDSKIKNGSTGKGKSKPRIIYKPAGYQYYHDPVTKKNKAFYPGDDIPEGMVKGKYLTDKQLLIYSLTSRLEGRNYDKPKGYLSPHYGKKWYHDESGKNYRIDTKYRPCGLTDGLLLEEKTRIQKNKRISDALKGKPKPYMQITNRNPDKIRKTADRHRGSKRGESACLNISNGKKRFYEEGGVNPVAGKVCYTNLDTMKIAFFAPDEIPKEGNWIKGNKATSKKLYHDPVTGIQKRFKEGEQPEGWRPGKCKS